VKFLIVVVVVNALPFLIVGVLAVLLALTVGGLGRTVGKLLTEKGPADNGHGPVAPGSPPWSAASSPADFDRSRVEEHGFVRGSGFDSGGGQDSAGDGGGL
jgi:hypothetical protein